MKDKIELLVRKIVMDYLNKDKKEQVNKEILIILDNQQDCSPEPIWAEIRNIACNYNVTVLFSEKWSSLPDDLSFVKCLPLLENHLSEIKVAMEKADVLFYATASYSTIAKLSLTIDDQLTMWITTQMQMNGKQILLANDLILQKGIQKVTTPFSVSKRIQTYLRQLREDKVQLTPLAGTRKWLDSYFESYIGNRHVVLAKHIEEVASQGESVLVVPKNSLITPMCKDYARELGVVIKQKE